MSTVVKDLGPVTAYAYAVAGGYTGTEEEFTELLGDLAATVANLESLTVTVTTLAPGSSATASYEDGVLALGIPQGAKGDTGTAATIAVGTVITVAPTQNASVTNTGSSSAAVFAFSIPRGDGVATVTKTGASGNVDTYTMTSDRGVTLGTFTVTNGNVSSVNGKTGAVVLDAEDLGYDDSETYSGGTVGAAVSDLKSEIDAIEEIIAAQDMTPLFIRNLVRQGKAQQYFQIGDQIDVPWMKGTTQYILPFDVVSFDPVLCEGDTEPRPAMWLQSHYAVEGVMFDQCEAFYVAPAGGLAAGTYNVTFVEKWGQIAANTTMEFTLTADVPEGGMLVFNTGLPDKTSASDVKLFVYANATTQTASETCLLTAGSSGTSLGSVSTATKYGAPGLNNYQRAVYGYNRWSQSAIRQWLNSDQPKNMWWTPKNEFDRAPAQLSTLDGFLAGFSADFRSALGKVKVTTALNTTSDSEIGTTEDTYDRMFPASLEQEYIVPQLEGAEGAYWPYWKERLGIDSPQAQGGAGAMAEHIRYAYENHSSAQAVRLRSANRGNAYNAWGVYTTGYANGSYATTALRPAPACVIC